MQIAFFFSVLLLCLIQATGTQASPLLYENSYAAAIQPTQIISPKLNGSGDSISFISRKGSKSAVYVQSIPGNEIQMVEMPSGWQAAWLHWGNQGRDLHIYAEHVSGNMQVFRVEADQRLAALIPDGWQIANSQVSDRNFYGQVWLRFRAPGGSLFDFDAERAALHPVSRQGSLVPAFIPQYASQFGQMEIGGKLRWYWQQNILFSPNLMERRIGFSPVANPMDGKSAWFLSATESDRQALVRVDMRTGRKFVHMEKGADISRVLLHPHSLAPAAISWDDKHANFLFFDQKHNTAMRWLRDRLGNDTHIVHMSYKLNFWLVETNNPCRRWYRFEYHRRSLQVLHGLLPECDDRLQKTMGFSLTASDGLPLLAYVTPPAHGSCTKPVCPLLVQIHGGPGARDFSSGNPIRNWWANQGYYVAHINYRGSSGFGKRFEMMDIGNWDARIVSDVRESLTYILRNYPKIDVDNIGLEGASFAGALALNWLARDSKLTCASVSMIAPDWLRFVEMMGRKTAHQTDLYKRVADPRTATGRQYLLQSSPLARVDTIHAPVLILQGALDPFAAEVDLQEFAEKLSAKGKMSYFVFADEKHGWKNYENKKFILSVQTKFFAKCFGSQAGQAVDFSPSSPTVKVMADHLKLLEK